MRITRLRLSGFKSFVEPADLRIEPGLTGVVGPNGCGKSNLLEALRWAMGENSPRSMRGAGMEDVIFAGTAQRPARDFAEVVIRTEDGDGEHEIVRRIERGAGSAYRIDGRDVRAKDVALLFADAATGAHSPALVSQNRIGAVIAARPQERRAMLEEAAGIAGLHVRRRDAEAKLRATEANREKLDAIIAEGATRVAALRRQVRVAQRYRDLSARIRVAEARLIYARWRDAARAEDAAKAEAAAAEEAVRAAGAAHEAAGAAQEGAALRLADTRAAAVSARHAAADAQHRLATITAARGAAERRLGELAEMIARLADDRTREGALAGDAAAALARLTDEAGELDAALARVAAERPALDAARTVAEAAGRDAEVALAQALARAAEAAAEARVAAAAVAQATQRLDRAARESAAAEAALHTLPDEAPLRTESARAREAAAQARAAAETARQAVSAGEAGAATLLIKREAAEIERAAARAEQAALEGEAAALTRALERRGGGDRLLDHVRVAPGYERALAAALGDELEVGLDPAADAHWSGADAAGDPAAPDWAVPLAGVVEAPAALARRLAQVLVVDADAGRPLAAGQRLVTRDGVMRRWDGLVVRAGGAAAAERLSRQNRLTAIERALPPARAAAADAEARTREIADDLARAQATAGEARVAAIRHDAAGRDAETAVARAATQLERLAGLRADAGARSARAAAEHDEAARELAVAEARRAALPDAAAANALVASLQREAAERRSAMAEARAACGMAERVAADLSARQAAGQAEVRSWKARAGDAARRIADMATREGALAEERATLADRPAALSAEVATLEEEVARASATTDAAAAAERAGEAALRDADARLRAAAEALAGARETRAGAVARAEAHELRRVEMGRVSGERFECPAPVLPERVGFESDSVAAPADETAAHDRLLLERERIGPVNLVAAQELAELETSGAGYAAEREELGQAVHRLRGSIGALNREGRQRLLAAFEAVDGHFRRLFTTLFDGGQAHLALVESDDPLEAGLEIMAQPPGKRLQSLTLLSGGEQALTAVALIFGLFLTNPAPICVLDEVDAPLDDANIERFCDLLDRMTRETETRYLIVTHNAVTMSRMHRLFGVTMVERGVSRLVSVDLRAAETLLAAE